MDILIIGLYSIAVVAVGVAIYNAGALEVHIKQLREEIKRNEAK